MNNIKYIGIDVHRATSVFVVMNPQGKVISETVLETKPDTILDFPKAQRGNVWATFEEGTYASWLYYVIQPQVAKLIVCDPRKNKLDGNKSDKIDARRLADLLRLNALKAVYHGQHSTLTLKELAHSYVNVQQDRVRIMNRVKARFRSRGVDCRGHPFINPRIVKNGWESLIPMARVAVQNCC